MKPLRTLGRILHRLVSVPEAEADPTFQPVLDQQTRRGMVVTAILGITGAVVFLLAQVLSGSEIVWIYEKTADGSVSLGDKTAILFLCLLLFWASRREHVYRWGRLLLGVVMIAAAVAIALDDLAQNDFSFTTAWFVLIQLVAITTVPFTPRQSLGIAASMFMVYVAMVTLFPDVLAPYIVVHRYAYFFFANVIVVTLSTYLYSARYTQHRYLEETRGLRDELAGRSEQLEQSLAELSAAQADLVRAERLAALGQVTSGVAHEIQNPLNFVINFAGLNHELVDELREVLEEAGLDQSGEKALVEEMLDDLGQNASSIDTHGRRASQIVDRMMEHSRTSSRVMAEVDLNDFVEQTVHLATERLRQRVGDEKVDEPGAVRIERDYGDVLERVPVQRNDMQAALLNLLDNALRAAMEGGREPTAHVRVQTREVGDGIEVEISDNGAGIPREVEDRLFEPFVTTRRPGEGAGLGLSLAYDTVTNGHDGSLSVESERGEGATFVVQIPREAGLPLNGETETVPSPSQR